MYHLSRNIFIVGLIIVLFFGLKVTSTNACGPLFPGTMLDKTDDELLKSPLADFRREIGRIKLSETPTFRAVRHEKSEFEQTAAAGLTDLQMALKIPAGNENDLLKKYALMRETIREHAKKMAEWKEALDLALC